MRSEQGKEEQNLGGESLLSPLPAPQSYAAWDGSKRRWRYADGERPGFVGDCSNVVCYDCRMPYSACGDCSIPDEIWERINPTEHIGAGILCANCIVERLHYIGIGGVLAMLW